MDNASVNTYLLDLQRRIVAALQALDGQPFRRDSWRRRRWRRHQPVYWKRQCVRARRRQFFARVRKRRRAVRHRRVDPSSLDVHLKPWAFHWCCIH